MTRKVKVSAYIDPKGLERLEDLSRECYQKFDEKVRELGGLWKAIEYFRKEVEKVE